MEEIVTVEVGITDKGSRQKKETKKPRKKRSLTAANLLAKKQKKILQMGNNDLQKLIGNNVDANGCWLIYGSEKNGKTWFTLQLVKMLSLYERVSYISAEEGTDGSFVLACTRANITASDRILFDEYMPIEEIVEHFSQPKSPNIIVIDNLTVYADELKGTNIKKALLDKLPDKLVILMAHEERKEPAPAPAKLAKKLSKVYVNVKGLRAFVGGRFSPGGFIDIEERNAELYWGQIGPTV